MRNLIILVLNLLMLGGCSTDVRPDDVLGPMTWGASENVTHVENLYFSEQPDSETLRFARANGVTTVVNLRGPAETDWNQEGTTRELGMDYVNAPVSRTSDSFDRNTIETLNTLMGERRDQRIFIYCSSGNRVAGWYAIYLVQQRGMEIDDALEVARRTGLTRQSIEDRVRRYLETSGG